MVLTLWPAAGSCRQRGVAHPARAHSRVTCRQRGVAHPARAHSRVTGRQRGESSLQAGHIL